MNTEHDVTAELVALTAGVNAATEGLSALRRRAPELERAVTAVEKRLAERTAELARANAEVEAQANRMLQLRTRIGHSDERLVSFRRRLARLASIVGET